MYFINIFNIILQYADKVFTQEQKIKIKEIVVNKQNEKIKRAIKIAENKTPNGGLLEIVIKEKNKNSLWSTKKGQSLEGLSCSLIF
ncbi:hypothetical protein QIA37_00335 (plasmid) [Borrelia sp. CA_690]|uniref:Uncharacterized protein n=1 Tax=Borrelia maritima TaxID=2761123 RepID=A0A5J6WF74_9SPIR|nr:MULTISPECIES: hypothetical protein [Borrelia]QFI14982.1 hypothetical protein DB723_04370 [Borrelia maritima]WKC83976.1 hypothetical protein QIA37_00335 [Borrelia sp. CA_690]